MATILTDDKNYKNIADSIRKKSGTNKKYTPTEMPTGVSEVYEKGKKDMAKAWWEQLYAEGQRRNFYYAFHQFDFSKVGGFNPVSQLIPYEEASYMFYKSKGLGKITKEQVDFKYADNLDSAFYNSDVEEIEYFYPYSCTALQKTFAYCYSLHTIGYLGLRSSSSKRYYINTFSYASALANINEIYGTFRGSISFASSPLTLESAVRVIMALDSSDESHFAYTISFKSSVWKLLEDNPPKSMGYDDIDAPDWKTYIINNKCWNYS